MPLPLIIPILGAVGGALSGIFGKKPSTVVYAPPQVTQSQLFRNKEQKANTEFMSMIRKNAIWIALAIVGMFMFFKKKR